MFSRISRYQALPDTVTTDSQGRTVPSKAVRLLPQVLGTFRHTVEEVDRLDHLAFKYYQQPQKWWRIVDANRADKIVSRADDWWTAWQQFFH